MHNNDTLTLIAGDTRIVMHKDALHQLLLSGVPDAILDMNAPERKEHDWLFFALKNFLRGIIPTIYKRFIGVSFPKLPPDRDIIAFSAETACSLVSAGVAGRIVEFHVMSEYNDGEEKLVYYVDDIVTVSESEAEQVNISARQYPAV